MSDITKFVSLAAVAGTGLAADSAAAVTTVQVNILATDTVSDVVIGGTTQYRYGGAGFKTASQLTPVGGALIGGRSSVPGVVSSDLYTANPVTILQDSGTTFAQDQYYHLKFDIGPETQLGYAHFGTTGTLLTVNYQAATVPEPASWTMLVTGFGAALI